MGSIAVDSEQVLVVVPTLGRRPEWLEDALSSVLSQGPNIDLRVRVVAPSSANVEAICSKFEVELLISERPGLSAAINDGWNHPHSAGFVTWLGDDDVLAPGSLAHTTQALMENPAAPAAYGQIRYIDERGATLWLQRPTRFAAQYMKVGKNLLPQQGSLLRWGAVKAIGGLNESFKSAMDQDLFMRLFERGGFVYVRRELGAFRLHASNITVTKGASGENEGDSIRRRYVRGHYATIRRVTSITDRMIYGVMRRLPASRPATVYGRPYTSSTH